MHEQTAKGVKSFIGDCIEYPPWLFPIKFSSLAKGLIVLMLHPDPQKRITVQEAQQHPWCAPAAAEMKMEENNSVKLSGPESNEQMDFKCHSVLEEEEDYDCDPPFIDSAGMDDAESVVSDDAGTEDEIFHMEVDEHPTADHAQKLSSEKRQEPVVICTPADKSVNQWSGQKDSVAFGHVSGIAAHHGAHTTVPFAKPVLTTSIFACHSQPVPVPIPTAAVNRSPHGDPADSCFRRVDVVSASFGGGEICCMLHID